MEIVIKIPNFEWLKNEEDFKTAVKEYEQGTRFDKEIRNALINGTPLPEHHGRLIDEQQIIDRFKPIEKFKDWIIGLDGLVCVLSDAPTIIEGSEECVLDKIRAEIEAKIVRKPWLDFKDRESDRNGAFLEVLEIIDKYKAESEDKE